MKSLAQIADEMMIEWAIQRRCEMDLIRRDHVRNMINYNADSATLATHLNFLLDEIPRANVQAAWVGIDHEPHEVYECNACGYGVAPEDINEYRFCPCCGASMGGDDKYDKMKEQKPCDDAISREAALNCFTATKLKKFDFILYAREEIKKLPSVTQKSKTGHWIKKEDDTCWWYACSECEQEPLKNRWNDDDVLSTFCPNCGARMVEPQESEGGTGHKTVIL